MRYLYLLLAAVPCSAAAVWALWPKRDVSHHWLVDHERRNWSSGYEGVKWKFPVKQ